MQDSRPPTHCPDEYDERSWTNLGECGEEFHSLVAEAQAAAARWLRVATAALATSCIGPISFPASTGASVSASGEVIDPSLVYVVISQARSGDDPVNALYLGVVTQDPASAWRGVTGFYLPYCGACCADAMQHARQIVDWLPDDAQVLPPEHLPEPIRPTRGWFERRMLLGVHLPGPAISRYGDYWRVWPQHGIPDERSPALACVGPLDSRLTNLLYLHDAARDLPSLGRLLPDWKPSPSRAPGISYRVAEQDVLLQLVGGLRSDDHVDAIQTVSIPGGLTRVQAPIDWGGFVLSSGETVVASGVSCDLRQVQRDSRERGDLRSPEKSLVGYSWPSGTGIIAFQHLCHLLSRLPVPGRHPWVDPSP